MTLARTHTYVILDVSDATYREIHDKLLAAGYENQLHDSGIDMYGIALAPAASEPESAE